MKKGWRWFSLVEFGTLSFLQCFDAVGSMMKRAPGLLKLCCLTQKILIGNKWSKLRGNWLTHIHLWNNCQNGVGGVYTIYVSCSAACKTANKPYVRLQYKTSCGICRYTIYSPKDGQPCMDHDRSTGEVCTNNFISRMQSGKIRIVKSNFSTTDNQFLEPVQNR